MSTSHTRVIEKDILVQKLANTWYIFSEINNDIIYTAIPKAVDPFHDTIELYHYVENHKEKVQRARPTFTKRPQAV